MFCKNKKIIIIVLSIMSMILFSSVLSSCNTDCEDNCDHGYCELGTCDCYTGWTGKYCDQAIGGGTGNCNFTPYYGA